MSSGHLKRLVAPRSWNIARKERTWTTKPMPGKHSLEGALPYFNNFERLFEGL